MAQHTQKYLQKPGQDAELINYYRHLRTRQGGYPNKPQVNMSVDARGTSLAGCTERVIGEVGGGRETPILSPVLSWEPRCLLRSRGDVWQPCPKAVCPRGKSWDNLCPRAQRWQRDRGDEGFPPTGQGGCAQAGASACIPQSPCRAADAFRSALRNDLCAAGKNWGDLPMLPSPPNSIPCHRSLCGSCPLLFAGMGTAGAG